MPEQAGDVPLTCADITKSGRLLGYAPKVKIDEGIPRVRGVVQETGRGAGREIAALGAAVLIN